MKNSHLLPLLSITCLFMLFGSNCNGYKITVMNLADDTYGIAWAEELERHLAPKSVYDQLIDKNIDSVGSKMCPYFTDENHNTGATIPSNGRGRFWDGTHINLKGISRIKQIKLYMKGSTINVPFDLMISEQALVCGNRENLVKSVTIVRRLKFTRTDGESIHINFSGEGILAGSVGISVANLLNNQFESHSDLFMSEISVYGELLRRIVPLDPKIVTPLPESALENKHYALRTLGVSEWEKFWPEGAPHKNASYFVKLMIPYGIGTACGIACQGKCNTVYGYTQNKDKGRFVVTNHYTLFTKSNVNEGKEPQHELVKSALNWVCKGCPTTSKVPQKVDPNKILLIWESDGALNKNDATMRLIELSQQGQPIFVIFQARGYSEGTNTYNVQILLKSLKVYFSSQYNHKPDCKRENSKVGKIIASGVYEYFRSGLGMHYLNSLKLIPAVGDESSEYGFSPIKEEIYLKKARESYNHLDYAILWRKYAIGCYSDRSVSERQNRLLDTYKAVYKKVIDRPGFPGLGVYPPMVNPDAPKDALIVESNAIWDDKIGSGGIGASTNMPFAVRGVTGVFKNDFGLKSGCRGDKLQNGARRFRSTENDFVTINDLGFKETVWYFTQDLNTDRWKKRATDEIGLPTTFTFAASGVYRTARFLYMHPKRKEIWHKSKRRTHFGKVELSGDRYGQCSTAESFLSNDFDDMILFMDIVEKWVKGQMTFQSGANPWNHRGQYINNDWQITHGFMHAGYPIAGNLGSDGSSGKSIMNHPTGGEWGKCHEIGHNVDNNDRVVCPDCVEVTNNVMCWEVINTSECYIKGIDPYTDKCKKKLFIPNTRFCEMNKIEGQWRTRTGPWVNAAAYGYFCYFGWKFGTAAVGNSWNINVNTDENVKFNKFERFAWAVSRVTKLDMGPYHKFMGFNFPDNVYEAMSKEGKECWLPHGDEWADAPEFKKAFEKFQLEIGRNCTGKHFTVTPFVRTDKWYNTTSTILHSKIIENIQNPFIIGMESA